MACFMQRLFFKLAYLYVLDLMVSFYITSTFLDKPNTCDNDAGSVAGVYHEPCRGSDKRGATSNKRGTQCLFELWRSRCAKLPVD